MARGGIILVYQLWVMAVALVCGLLIALFYDMYWLLIVSRYRARWLAALQDILFWLAIFCLIAALWLYCTGGVMRLAVYLWLGLGIIVFRRLFSRSLRRLRPPLRLPPAAQRATPPSTPPPAEKAPPPWLQNLRTWPSSVMLKAGLGFWRGLAWSARQSRRGGAWLCARLPKKKPPPEE